MRKAIALPALLVAVAAFGLTGCGHRHHDPHHGPGVGHGHGPPPHAPAHGHRAKMHERDLQFDAHRGVYLVVGLPGIYWHGGWYFRLARDRWQRSSRWDGPWHDSRWGDIPLGLRGGPAHPGKGKGKGKKKGWD